MKYRKLYVFPSIEYALAFVKLLHDKDIRVGVIFPYLTNRVGHVNINVLSEVETENYSKVQDLYFDFLRSDAFIDSDFNSSVDKFVEQLSI